MGLLLYLGSDFFNRLTLPSPPRTRFLMKSITIFLTLVASSLLWAEERPATSGKGEAFAAYIENDTRAMGGPGSDQAYSNGFKFSYIFAQDRIPAFAYPSIQKMNFLESIDHTKSNFAISIGHQIFTPNNKGQVNLIPDDRPYAGWLYLALAMNLKDEKQEHVLELDLGIVGPSALGEQVQNEWHRLHGLAPFLGWKNQLRDEPTLQVSYQRRVRVYSQEHWDFIPYYGAGLGNVLIAAHTGALVRLGTSLPKDFGPSRPSAADGDSFVAPTERGPGRRDLSFYGFAGARVNAVAHNLFLDGNTWKDSHNVRKRHFVIDTELGVGAQLLPWSVVWRFVTRSPEFYDSARPASFASLNIVYFFDEP